MSKRACLGKFPKAAPYFPESTAMLGVSLQSIESIVDQLEGRFRLNLCVRL